jgi:large subunit ribosomal protein L30e
LDFTKALRLAVDSGKVVFGRDSVKKICLNGGAKLVVVAKNCPVEAKNDVERFCSLSEIKLIVFEGSSLNLGVACGKPFPVSALAVMEAGNSEILKEV